MCVDPPIYSSCVIDVRLTGALVAPSTGVAFALEDIPGDCVAGVTWLCVSPVLPAPLLGFRAATVESCLGSSRALSSYPKVRAIALPIHHDSPFATCLRQFYEEKRDPGWEKATFEQACEAYPGINVCALCTTFGFDCIAMEHHVAGTGVDGGRTQEVGVACPQCLRRFRYVLDQIQLSRVSPADAGVSALLSSLLDAALFAERPESKHESDATSASDMDGTCTVCTRPCAAESQITGIAGSVCTTCVGDIAFYWKWCQEHGERNPVKVTQQ